MSQGRITAIAITVVLGMWTTAQAIEASAPGSLGLHPPVLVWVGIVMSGLGILQGFLPKIMPPDEPD
jgi:hypothetical protein